LEKRDKMSDYGAELLRRQLNGECFSVLTAVVGRWRCSDEKGVTGLPQGREVCQWSSSQSLRKMGSQGSMRALASKYICLTAAPFRSVVPVCAAQLTSSFLAWLTPFLSCFPVTLPNPSFSTCPFESDLAKNPIDLVSVGLVDESNLYEWEILIMGPDGTLYEGGFFKARLVFPADFPNMPPTMTFTSEMWHPNVYADGKVCISILHPPGEDEYNSQESADERWRPILGVEQILVSVISMLSDPNDESPANLDAAVMWRNDRAAFKKKVRQVVRKSQEEC
jgi:ubiquitin-conjugating enzyme E2 G1